MSTTGPGERAVVVVLLDVIRPSGVLILKDFADHGDGNGNARPRLLLRSEPLT